MGQFKALSYKNWVLYKRGYVGSCLQLIIPILFIGFILMTRKLLTITQYSQQQYFNNVTAASTFTLTGNLPSIAPYLKKCNTSDIVALTPSGNTLVNDLNSSLTGLGYTVKIYNSDSEIDTEIRDPFYGNPNPKICFGISINESTAGSSYTYKLRFNISSSAGSSDGPSTSRSITSDIAIDLPRFYSTVSRGMLGAVSLMQSIILQKQTGNSNDYFEHTMGPIYQQYYINDPVYSTLGNSIQILVMLPLILIYLRQVSAMLSQKQKKIRQSMSIMGMSTFIYYATWFLRYFAVYLVIHLVGSAILIAGFPRINFGMFLLIFILFDLVLIFQAKFIQIFFTRAKIGIVIALLFFVIQYVISFVISTSDNPTLKVNQMASIVPHIAFILCFRTMVYADSVRLSLSFTDLVNNYTMVSGVVALLLNILFWAILTWYLDQVVPNEWGAKKHPCFCCFGSQKDQQNQITELQNKNYGSEMKKNQQGGELSLGSKKVVPFQTSQVKLIKLDSQLNGSPDIQQVQAKFKQMQRNNETIQLKKLTKTFNDGEKIAVNNLNLNIYNDQIFVLLGHNGAGKTTTISMITGMLSQSQGIIKVFGKTSIEERRKMMGICPQHDTLYDQLTVEQHLYLFGTFKGLQGQQLQAQIDKLIADVNLTQKRDEYSMNLSGGQKRRLSVAMAFAGRSKVIILDQPTSGMDTSARRYIWDMLKDYKNDRVILLTTHFMDEADYLGDRIGIMGGGKLITCGSSIYLKNKFGVGYNITFVKKSTSVNSQNITSLVKKHISEAKVLSNVSSQLSIQLPLDQVKKFDQLFNEIDSKMSELQIQTYGISITTLEEVFLKVSQEYKAQEQQQFQSRKMIKTRGNSRIQKVNGLEKDEIAQIQVIQLKSKKDIVDSHQQSGFKMNPNQIQFDESLLVKQQLCCGSFWRHLKTTLLKRFRVIRRDLKSFLFELILPIIIIVLALLLMRVSFISDQPQKKFDLQYWNHDSSPILLGIAGTDSTTLTNMESKLNGKYNSSILELKKDPVDITDTTFDLNYLKNQKTKFLRGGLFFNPSVLSGGGNKYSFSSIVNTRTTSAALMLPLLATQTIINQATSSNISISFYNSPFPRTNAQLSINNSISGFFGAFVFSIALAFKFASIISFIVKERFDRSKHQQIVSGMNLASYWVGNYIYDLILYFVVAAVSIGLIKILNVTALIQGDAFLATILSFLLFGIAYIPLTYVASYLFSDYGNAQAGWYFFTFISGGILPIAAMVLRIINPDTNIGGHIIGWACRIFPSYCFGEALLNMGTKTLYGIVELDPGQFYQIFDMTIALAPLIYMGIFFVFNFFIVFLIQKLQRSQSFMRFFTSEGSIVDTKEIEDSDVLEEQKKSLNANPNDYVILTKNLRKVYNKLDSQTGYKVAVDNLSLTVQQGQVFGLLGINGAGKTTTFKMLAGQITSTSGDSFFNGLKISQNLEKIRQNLGYCPQFDALIQNLTVRQQIQMFYDLKSLPTEFKDEAITAKIKQMNLQQYTDQLSGTLSGGNKRKLSVAMAMIGNPSIIFLDQPSTGMDPKARRFMWKVISRIATQKKKSTVILTTHSMQQAQALSTRLGIMVGGNFKCIGTPQHIKSKYGEGLQIEIKMNPCKKQQVYQRIDAVKLERGLEINHHTDQHLLQNTLNTLNASQAIRDEIKPNKDGSYLLVNSKISLISLVQFILIEQKSMKLTQWMKNIIGQSQILEHYQTFIRYKVSKGKEGKLPVGKIFGSFQNNKDKLDIQNYSIKQASVQQIFNKFAQEDESALID